MLFTTKQAAEYLGVSKSFLEKDRLGRGMLKHVRLGKKMIRYQSEDLDDFIKKSIRTSTSDYR